MSEPKRYPQAYVAQGAGDLVQATSVTTALKNGGKQVSTLRMKEAGYTLGVRENTVTVELAIDEDGMERDFYNDCMEGRPTQLRVKPPGGTVRVYNGTWISIDENGPLDDKVTATLVFVGKLDRPQPAAA
jgi:hypothetical protein